MAAFFLLKLALVVFVVADVAATMLAVFFPDLERHFPRNWEWYVTGVTGLPIVALFVLWLWLLRLAFAGSMRQVMLLKRLTQRSWIVRLSFLANCFVLSLIPIVVALAFHATSLTRTSHEGAAAVYFLYDEGIPVPRWAYALGLYRVSLQAQRNWGAGCTVLDRLNKETLRAAFAHGKVVMLATHGGEGYACTYYAAETLCVGPPTPGATNEVNGSRFLRSCVLPYDWESWKRLKEEKWEKWDDVGVNSELRLVYIFACDAGKRASQWEEHLAPAQVITYNRPSTVLDHGLWFAFTGQKQLKVLQ